MLGGDARLDAVRLVELVTGRDSAWQLAHGGDTLTAEDAARLDALVARRAAGEPLAYVTGEAWFYGRRFTVTPDVLVPRPETELVVELARAALAHRPAMTFCDVGTGSGILVVTLLLELPGTSAFATDVSGAALAVARGNARVHGVDARVRFFVGDALAPLPDGVRLDAIVANLPYVRTADVPARPDPLGFEPRVALDGGADGLDAYRSLLAGAPHVLAHGGVLLMEGGPDTVPALAGLAARAFHTASTTVHRDLAGRDRVVEVRREG